MAGLLSRGCAAIAAGFALSSLVSFQAEAGSQYVVVASEPPAEEYKPGRVLEVSDTIVIPAGTVVTLLGEDGSVNAIPGPASITVTEDSVETVGEDDVNAREKKRSTISKLAELLSGEKKNADSLGVARSVGTRPKPRGLDDPWVISIHGDGPGCIREGEIRLGRNTDRETLSVAVTGDDQDSEKILTWRKGQADITLPASLPVEKGEIFVRAGAERARISLQPLPESVSIQNPVEVLGWMMESGCQGQALAFTRQLVIEAQ